MVSWWKSPPPRRTRSRYPAFPAAGPRPSKCQLGSSCRGCSRPPAAQAQRPAALVRNSRGRRRNPRGSRRPRDPCRVHGCRDPRRCHCLRDSSRREFRSRRSEFADRVLHTFSLFSANAGFRRVTMFDSRCVSTYRILSDKTAGCPCSRHDVPRLQRT